MATSSPPTHASVVPRGVRPRKGPNSSMSDTSTNSDAPTTSATATSTDPSRDTAAAKAAKPSTPTENSENTGALPAISACSPRRRQSATCPSAGERQKGREPTDDERPRTELRVVHGMQRHEELVRATHIGEEQQRVQVRQLRQKRRRHLHRLPVERRPRGVAHQQVVGQHAHAPQHDAHTSQQCHTERARFKQRASADDSDARQRERYERHRDVATGDIEELMNLAVVEPKRQVV